MPYKQGVTGSSPVVPTSFLISYASVAQLVEQGTENPRVVGSIPTGGTIYADLAHLVERHLAKVEVASSSLVIRSILLMPIKFNWHFFDRESVQFNMAP